MTSDIKTQYVERVRELLEPELGVEDLDMLCSDLEQQLSTLQPERIENRLGSPEEFVDTYRASAGLPPRTERSDTEVWPESVSKMVTGTVWIGYGLAIAASAVAIVGNELFQRAVLDGLVVLALFTVPSVLAMLSQPRRPMMLLPAGIIGLLGLFGMGSVLGLPLVILGVIWLWAYLKTAPPDRWLRKASMILVPLLWLGATFALWVHLDPGCEQRLRDGTIVEVDPATRGFESGWTWEVGSSFSGSSGTISEGVVSEACTSNTLVVWEALAAIALCGLTVLVGFNLVNPSDTKSSAPQSI
jgi:hypothetical protein